MTIMFITHYTAMYGANRSLLDLLEGLRAYNVNPIVVIPDKGELCEFLDLRGITYIIQDFKKWNFVHTFNGTWRNKLSYVSKRIKLGIKTKTYNSKCLISLDRKVSHLKFDLIYSNSSVFNFGFKYSEKHSIPHVWHFREIQDYYNYKWIFSENAVNHCFKNSDLLVAISYYVKNYYQLKNNLHNIKVEYDSVLSLENLSKLDIDRKEFRSKKPHLVTFGIVGVIDNNKGQVEAIMALNEVVKLNKNVRLLIAGGGDLQKLKKLIRRLDLQDYVEVLGEVRNPFEIFIEIDVYLMCSKKEGLGRVTLEAMAASLPIIGFKDGGTRELIKENVNGLFYKTDYHELAIKMHKLIDDEQLRTSLGAKGREIFEKKFTNEIYTKKMYSLLKQIILNL